MDAADPVDMARPRAVQTAALVIFAAALPFSVTLIQGGLLLFIAVSLFLRKKEGTLSQAPAELKAAPLLIPWLAYLAAGVLAAAFGVNPARSFAALPSDLLTAAAYLGLVLFIRPGPRDKALKAYLAAVVVAAVLGSCQALSGLAGGQNIRAHGVSHYVRFGEIMAIGLALALSLLSYPDTLSSRARKIIFAAAMLILSAVALSQTRGAYLGIAFVFLVLLAARRPPIRVILPVLAAASALFLGISLLSPAVRHRLSSITEGATSAINAGAKTGDVAINTRFVLWSTGFKMIKDRPLLGAGPASVKRLFPVYCEKPYPENIIWGSLHNLYIHQTAERGLVGLAALLLLFGAMFIAALCNFRRAPSPLSLWALSLMPAWFVMNLTEISFQHVHTSYAVFFALALSITAPES